MEELKLIKEFENFFIGNIEVGKDFFIIAGPCAVESEESLLETAKKVKEAGANMLRGGAFKPRTTPYSFQGLEEEGLKILSKAREETGLPIVTEVMSKQDIPLIRKYTNVFQVGTRNMYNYSMLKALGKEKKPVLLKRAFTATMEEWLGSAEYIMKEGNKKVILCERGVRSFDNYTRNLLDLMAIPIIKKETNLPIIVDPSHGTGRKDLVFPASKAALALESDGLIIEAHHKPDEALTDKKQTISIEELKKIVNLKK